MKTLDHIIADLPPARRAKVQGRARELLGEEMALQQLRKAHRLTQEQMARALHVGQDSISKLESRSDLLISTLRSYVEAMGGALKIVVEFKSGSVVIPDLSSTAPAARSKPSSRTALRKKRHLELAHAE
jgi:transcriptional regulator with XRE-family HTH domain